jgi:hypothetical protein
MHDFYILSFGPNEVYRLLVPLTKLESNKGVAEFQHWPAKECISRSLSQKTESQRNRIQLSNAAHIRLDGDLDHAGRHERITILNVLAHNLVPPLISK